MGNRNLARLIGLGAVSLLMAGGTPAPIPTVFQFEGSARPGLHRLWSESVMSKAERVACLAGSIESDTVHITGVLALEPGPSDSLGISAGESLDTCAPPSWKGTVHTHVALRDGRQPYSLFSGADRGIMMLWWRRWQEDGIFCLLYSEREVICEIEGPQGAVLFPRSRY
jgi:hypothetical protein